MKKLFYLLGFTLLFSLAAQAQNDGISFQGLARNAAGEVLVSQKVSLRLSILLGSESGAVAYTETRQTITNPQGIFAVVVGDNTTLTKSSNFSEINWGTASKFIKVEMDPNAGTNFTVMGTSKLQPVPFAFYAYGVDAENVDGILPLGSGGTGVASIAALKTSLGVDQINNTADASKPISTATQDALNTKVDKVSGKELSTNDYSTTEKTKLAAISGTNTGDQDLSAFATTTQLATKVDKEIGKGLSSNDYTSAEKTKLAAITGTNTGDQDLSGYATTSQVSTKANTADVTTSLATKVDKVTGKDLSTNDYTTAEKTKLAAITGTNTGDQVNITGNAATATTASTVTTNANLTGIVTSVGNATSIADGAITDAKITALAAAKITGTLPVANGGTGQTTFIDGQLLIGNSSGNTLTKATLTAGAGISVTNGNGTIAIANTGGLPATGNTAGEMLFWNGSAWVKVAAGANGQTLTFYNGAPIWVGVLSYSYAGATAYANTVLNPKTGKIWMDRNLGATQVATSSDDVAAYGDLYQWGRGADGHQIRTSETIAIRSSADQPEEGKFITINSGNDWRFPQNDNLWQGVAGVNNPCPTGYRIPTLAEWDAERLSWTGGSNATGALASSLKLGLAGFRSFSAGGLGSAGIGGEGYYWSSTVSGTRSRMLVFTSGFAQMDSNYRAFGFSVRCLKD
jgi:uncharacterized protein (TIGR02145 family)